MKINFGSISANIIEQMEHLELIFLSGFKNIENCHRIEFTDGSLFKGLCHVIP